MDFNEFKNTWKNSFKDEEFLNKQEIEHKLKIKSKSSTALKKVKRNYQIELILGGSMSLVFIIIMIKFLYGESRILLPVITFIFFGILLLFTWRNYNKIRYQEILTDQLKPTLKQIIIDIERYVNFNRSNFSKYLLIPFAIAFGMILGIFMGLGDVELNEVLFVLQIKALKLATILVVVSGISIPLSLFMNKRMYKNHLDELKQCLKDFEEIED